jgi:hypothetical protein
MSSGLGFASWRFRAPGFLQGRAAARPNQPTVYWLYTKALSSRAFSAGQQAYAA